MAIGLGLGKIKDLGSGITKIYLEKDAVENPKPLDNLVLVSGITHLAYYVIFNIITPLDVDTGIGSRLTDIIGAGGFASNNRIQAVLEINQEITSLENRLKAYQNASGTSLSADQILERIEVQGITLDYEAQQVTIDLKIYNSLNEGVLVQV